LSDVLAITEYYNEKDNILGLVQSLSQQTMKPVLWILIDDGSTDESTTHFKRELENTDIPHRFFKMPPKERPDANKKGRAFQKLQDLNRSDALVDKYDYLIKIDADTRLPPYFIEFGARIMNHFPNIGVMAGRIRGETGGEVPMGTGKFVRWSVVQQTQGNYWDLDPDSLWNIKSTRLGYRNLIVEDLKIDVTRPTQVSGPGGEYDYGCRMFYVNRSPLLVINYAVSLFLSEGRGLSFLRGYLREMARGIWRFEDEDVRYFYGLTREILRKSGLLPTNEVTIMASVGFEQISDASVDEDFMQQSYSAIRESM
jgi:glycosyltransferase involved in cell wall biosynthesis